MPTRLLQALRVRDDDGRFSLPLLVADSLIATWLLVAFHSFQGLSLPSSPLLAIAAGCFAVSAWACGLHRDWNGRGFAFGWRVLLFLFLVGGALHLLSSNSVGTAIGNRSNWLAAMLLAGGLTARAVYWRLHASHGWAPLETLRWGLLATVATWALWPIYTTKPTGAGDAYWYVIMLSDYLEQLRAGVFPVWIGQSEFAFNGAFSPLRLAPGFQHAGGVLDVLTFHTLSFLAVKNLLLATSALASAFCAYFSLRAILPRSPSLACGLALTYLLSPGLMAPLYAGDQYMTFLAAPFLPVVCYALWRCFARNDVKAHVLLAVAVAALWNFHTPVALWTSFFASAIYVVKIWHHRRSRRELGLVAVAIIIYGLLGTYPLFSALSIDNLESTPTSSRTVIAELKGVFPGILQPIKVPGIPSASYQPGYAALLAGIIGLGLAVYRRNLPALAFAGASIGVAVFILPVPGVNALLWTHLPATILKVTNVWPFQRLALIWVALLLFTLAAGLAGIAPTVRARWFRPLIFSLVTVLLCWSSYQLGRINVRFLQGIPTDNSWQVLYAKHNMILSRYSYSSFQSPPTYFSHGYMEPLLESRLLDRASLAIIVSNAESAASSGKGKGRTLIAEGVFHATNDNGHHFYKLTPNPLIESGRHYALRMEFLSPGETGWLQVRAENLFREYMLPDSGSGMHSGTTALQSFGSTPNSSAVMPLSTRSTQATPLFLTSILPDRPITQEFEWARFQLWEYDPAELPIRLHTLLPYRVRIESPEPAFLESPRMWLGSYRAKVNGKRQPVLRSPNNLAMVEIDAGITELEIKYVPSLPVELSYWITLGSWAVLLAAALRELCLRPRLQGR